MNFPTMYSSSISDYLVIHDFHRHDDQSRVDFMEWSKKTAEMDVTLRFEGTGIKVFRFHEKFMPQQMYRLEGFIPSDYILFVFLMHSWNIISIQSTVKLLRENNVADLRLENIFGMVKEANNGSGN